MILDMLLQNEGCKCGGEQAHYNPSSRITLKLSIIAGQFGPAKRSEPFNDSIIEHGESSPTAVLLGTLGVTLGKVQYQLHKGDCLVVRMDQLTMFHNPGEKMARYAVVTVPDRKPSTS